MCLLKLGGMGKDMELIPNCREVEMANAFKSQNDDLSICRETTIDGFIRLENNQTIFKYFNILLIFFKSPLTLWYSKRYVKI